MTLFATTINKWPKACSCNGWMELCTKQCGHVDIHTWQQSSFSLGAEQYAGTYPAAHQYHLICGILGSHSGVSEDPSLCLCQQLQWHTPAVSVAHPSSFRHPRPLIWRCTLRHVTGTHDGKGKGNLSLCTPWRRMWGWTYSSTHS